MGKKTKFYYQPLKTQTVSRFESSIIKSIGGFFQEIVQLGWAQKRNLVIRWTPGIVPRMGGAQKDRLAFQSWL